MIITRTPLRVSLVGGATDQPGYYKQGFGAVVSFAINKYIYISVNRKFDGKTRVSYSKTENVDHSSLLQHDLVRESMLDFGIDGVEIVSVADIPGGGTGLGSSSTFTVGLVKALQKYNQEDVNAHPNALAERAYKVERNRCSHPVGKQDHYAAAYGNLHFYKFESDGTVIAELINFNDAQLRELESRFTLLWTGRNRRSGDILRQQEANFSTERRQIADSMRDMAVSLRNDLRNGDISTIGQYLAANWEAKRQLAKGITNNWIDQKHEAGLNAGAEGGKICGAGGGGFLLFYGPLGIGPALEKATGLRRVPFNIETKGSEVIYG